MPNVTVTLKTPIEAPGTDASGPRQITEIVLREPKYMDAVLLGEPSSYGQSEAGIMFTAERDGVVQGYIERLLVEPKDPQLLVQLSLADTLQLKEAVFGFFAAARKAISS